MNNGGYKILIVEGDTREINILNSVTNFFFPQKKVKFISLPAGENIYMLWQKLKDDEFNTDLIEIVRERIGNNCLKGIERKEVDEIFLFFDFDGQQNNLPANICAETVMKEMLEVFSDETEMGKLYISYPMIEAIRDWDENCSTVTSCIWDISNLDKYKNQSAAKDFNNNIGHYDKLTWTEVIRNYILRTACLFDLIEVPTYKFFKDNITPQKIYLQQSEKYIKSEKVFVLSAIPEFILDYFDQAFWKSWIKVRKTRKANNCTLR